MFNNSFFLILVFSVIILSTVTGQQILFHKDTIKSDDAYKENINVRIGDSIQIKIVTGGFSQNLKKDSIRYDDDLNGSGNKLNKYYQFSKEEFLIIPDLKSKTAVPEQNLITIASNHTPLDDNDNIWLSKVVKIYYYADEIGKMDRKINLQLKPNIELSESTIDSVLLDKAVVGRQLIDIPINFELLAPNEIDLDNISLHSLRVNDNSKDISIFSVLREGNKNKGEFLLAFDPQPLLDTKNGTSDTSRIQLDIQFVLSNSDTISKTVTIDQLIIIPNPETVEPVSEFNWKLAAMIGLLLGMIICTLVIMKIQKIRSFLGLFSRSKVSSLVADINSANDDIREGIKLTDDGMKNLAEAIQKVDLYKDGVAFLNNHDILIELPEKESTDTAENNGTDTVDETADPAAQNTQAELANDTITSVEEEKENEQTEEEEYKKRFIKLSQGIEAYGEQQLAEGKKEMLKEVVKVIKKYRINGEEIKEALLQEDRLEELMTTYFYPKKELFQKLQETETEEANSIDLEQFFNTDLNTQLEKHFYPQHQLLPSLQAAFNLKKEEDQQDLDQQLPAGMVEQSHRFLKNNVLGDVSKLISVNLEDESPKEIIEWISIDLKDKNPDLNTLWDKFSNKFEEEEGKEEEKIGWIKRLINLLKSPSKGMIISDFSNAIQNLDPINGINNDQNSKDNENPFLEEVVIFTRGHLKKMLNAIGTYSRKPTAFDEYKLINEEDYEKVKAVLENRQTNWAEQQDKIDAKFELLREKVKKSDGRKNQDILEKIVNKHKLHLIEKISLWSTDLINQLSRNDDGAKLDSSILTSIDDLEKDLLEQTAIKLEKVDTESTGQTRFFSFFTEPLKRLKKVDKLLSEPTNIEKSDNLDTDTKNTFSIVIQRIQQYFKSDTIKLSEMKKDIGDLVSTTVMRAEKRISEKAEEDSKYFSPRFDEAVRLNEEKNRKGILKAVIEYLDHNGDSHLIQDQTNHNQYEQFILNYSPSNHTDNNKDGKESELESAVQRFSQKTLTYAQACYEPSKVGKPVEISLNEKGKQKINYFRLEGENKRNLVKRINHLKSNLTSLTVSEGTNGFAADRLNNIQSIGIYLEQLVDTLSTTKESSVPDSLAIQRQLDEFLNSLQIETLAKSALVVNEGKKFGAKKEIDNLLTIRSEISARDQKIRSLLDIREQLNNDILSLGQDIAAKGKELENFKVTFLKKDFLRLPDEDERTPEKLVDEMLRVQKHIYDIALYPMHPIWDAKALIKDYVEAERKREQKRNKIVDANSKIDRFNVAEIFEYLRQDLKDIERQRIKGSPFDPLLDSILEEHKDDHKVITQAIKLLRDDVLFAKRMGYPDLEEVREKGADKVVKVSLKEFHENFLDNFLIVSLDALNRLYAYAMINDPRIVNRQMHLPIKHGFEDYGIRLESLIDTFEQFKKRIDGYFGIELKVPDLFHREFNSREHTAAISGVLMELDGQFKKIWEELPNFTIYDIKRIGLKSKYMEDYFIKPHVMAVS